MDDRTAMAVYLGMRGDDPIGAGVWWFTHQRDRAKKELRRWFMSRKNRDYWQQQLKLAEDFLMIDANLKELMREQKNS